MDMFKTPILKKIKREINLLRLKFFARGQEKIQKLETDVEREQQKVKVLELKLKKKNLKKKRKKIKKKLRK